MPTGLTAKIYEGEETSLREFALTCAAQLSPCHIVTDRGSKPMPMDKAPVIKPEQYRRQQLRMEEEELERWQHLKAHPDELRKEYEADCTKRELENIGLEKRYADIRKRYDDMIGKVEQWQVPEAYASLKSLMMKQLTESRDFDCPEGFPRHDPPCTMEEWIDTRIECSQRVVERYREDIEKETEWLTGANEWLQGLYRALDEVSPWQGE